MRLHISTEVAYPKGSIVLCASCLKPLYRLVQDLHVGEAPSRTRDAYRPLSAEEFKALAERAYTDPTISPGLAALWRSWTPRQRHELAARIPDPRNGTQTLCPFCSTKEEPRSWVRVRAEEAARAHDHAYVWELLTLLPDAPVTPALVQAWGR